MEIDMREEREGVKLRVGGAMRWREGDRKGEIYRKRRKVRKEEMWRGGDGKIERYREKRTSGKREVK